MDPLHRIHNSYNNVYVIDVMFYILIQFNILLSFYLSSSCRSATLPGSATDQWEDFPQKANDYRKFFIQTQKYCRQENEFYKHFIKPINANHEFTVKQEADKKNPEKRKRTYESKDRSIIITTEPLWNNDKPRIRRSKVEFTNIKHDSISWICHNVSIDLRPITDGKMQLWLMSGGKCRKSVKKSSQTPAPTKRRRKDDKSHGSKVDKSTQTSSDSSSSSPPPPSSKTSSSKQTEYSFIILAGFILITFYQI